MPQREREKEKKERIEHAESNILLREDWFPSGFWEEELRAGPVAMGATGPLVTRASEASHARCSH